MPDDRDRASWFQQLLTVVRTDAIVPLFGIVSIVGALGLAYGLAAHHAKDGEAVG